MTNVEWRPQFHRQQPPVAEGLQLSLANVSLTVLFLFLCCHIFLIFLSRKSFGDFQ